jgi:proteasome lid subunit RPN8/RPN11
VKSWPIELLDSAAPERVGVVLRNNSVIELRNLSPNPVEGFIVDVAELLPHLPETVSTWHTHPKGDALPSPEDLDFFRRWPDLTHFIISPAGIKEYEVEDGEILCK